jgi:hypothetical protein
MNGEEARRIVKAVREVLSGAPAPGGAALQDGVFPPAWGGWLLLCLLRQLSRQRWLLAMVHERLSGDEVADEGDIPGYWGWSYCFHGRGCRFVGPGEMIDMDFHGDAGATIDPYFFCKRILTLDSPELPEARLAALLPGESLIDAALQELRAQGLIGHPESQHDFRLAPELEALAEAAATLDVSGEEARKRCLAHLGDFEALGPLPGGDMLHAQVEAARQARRDWLLALAHRPRTSKEAICALELLLTKDQQLQACERIIDEWPVSSAPSAVEWLDAMPGAAGSEAVLRLLGRLSPEEDHPADMYAAARYLLRRGIERERTVAALLAFARVELVPGYHGNPYAADLAFLALEYVHEHALELVRRALRSSVPISRMMMVTVLFALDRPWCQRELAAALRESDRKKGAVCLALALSRSSSDWARAVAARWRRENPPDHDPTGFGYTDDEMEEANSSTWFESELEDARAWVEHAGARIPEELSG